MKKLESTLRAKSDASKADGLNEIVCASFGEASALVLITGEGKRWVFPWIHFLYAWHEGQIEFERIMLYYSSHEVEIKGIRLECLVKHFSKFGIEWIRSYESRYSALCPKDLPFVDKIIVSEKTEPEYT